MQEKSRTKTIYINSMVTLLSQIAQVIIGFVLRKIFINTLGISYLGYNSVFSNILQMLNLADLGIGIAITSFLFKPIADGDKSRISTLMYFYKKIFNIIGVVVFVFGIIVSLVLNVLVPDAACSLGYLRVLFYINLAGTVSTYFLAYKRTLIIAYQKSYITNLVDMTMYFIISAAQAFFLLMVPNYISYLILQVAKNVISNIILSVHCDKEYGMINKKADEKLLEEYKPQIIQYVRDVSISRIGSIIFYGTDNVIISIFRGSLLAGYLSNYTMITTQLTSLVNQILASLQATFGNYVHSGKSLDEQRQMTDNYFCVNFCIGNFCMICFTLLVQPFVKMFFGQTLVLSFSTALWLGINLMLTMLIQLPSQVFVIYKLYKYDRPFIITSAILNIAISVSLVRVIGIDGVLIGTFVTSLTYLFSRFYIIAKYVYKIPYRFYVQRILMYFAISTASFMIAYFACRNIIGETIVSFVVRMVFVGLLTILMPAAILSFTKEFQFLSNKLLPQKVRKLSDKYVLCGASVIIIILSIVIGGQLW